MTGRDDSGRCSFCGREQQEVGSLFSCGEGGICARCIELAVDALDREVEGSLDPGEQPVRTLQRRVERHRRLSDLFLAFSLLYPDEVPGHLVEAMEQAAASSRALETEVRHWIGSGRRVTETDPQVRLAHVAAKLVALQQPLRAWRATLLPGLPGGQLYAIDQALTALATLARVLKDPSPEGSGRRPVSGGGMKKEHAVNLQCTFCGKSQDEVRKLIAGPTVYICDECIKLCNDIIAKEAEAERGDRPPEEAPTRPKREGEGRKSAQTLCCSFCGKTQREVRKLIAGPTVYICDECIGLCNDIIADEIEREETGAGLRARLPRGIRALIAAILERGRPAADTVRDGLNERIIAETARPRTAGERPDRLVWAPWGLAADWRDLHALLAGATFEKSASGEEGPLEGELLGWVSPITERLAGILEVLDVLARSLEEPGLERLRQLSPSVEIAVEKLREARELLLAGPPKSPEAPR